MCNEKERYDLLNKYFSQYEQQQIRANYIQRKNLLRLRCYNRKENCWKSINYKCGTMTITKSQWYKLHSCFQSISTTTLPSKFNNKIFSFIVMDHILAAIVSMNVDELTPSCPPPVIPGDPCEYQTGEYIFDIHGCARKICPSLSQLCHVS